MSRARCLALISSLLLVCGCGRLPTTHYYVLELPGGAGETTASGNPDGLRIGVAVFRVSPPYDQDRIAYRVGEGSPEIGFYHYHRWAAPLSRMLPGVVAAALAGTEGVGSIEPAGPGREYAAHLHGRLLALEEVDLPEGQRVRVRLELSLRLANGTELWSETLDGGRTTRIASVRAMVEEIGRVLGRLLEEARGRLAAALRSAESGG